MQEGIEQNLGIEHEPFPSPEVIGGKKEVKQEAVDAHQARPVVEQAIEIAGSQGQVVVTKEAAAVFQNVREKQGLSDSYNPKGAELLAKILNGEENIDFGNPGDADKVVKFMQNGFTKEIKG